MPDDLKTLKDLILTAAEKAREETSDSPEPELTQSCEWPIECTVGPGLEGAIACESKIGYVNGSKGWLIYRGYDIFDLCAHSTYEEVSYLLMHGSLPTESQLSVFKQKLVNYRIGVDRNFLNWKYISNIGSSKVLIGTSIHNYSC